MTMWQMTWNKIATFEGAVNGLDGSTLLLVDSSVSRSQGVSCNQSIHYTDDKMVGSKARFTVVVSG